VSLAYVSLTTEISLTHFEIKEWYYLVESAVTTGKPDGNVESDTPPLYRQWSVTE
jgi:hypothetical protein